MNRFHSVVTNVGVFLGLILLAYEMRQNSDLMRAQISMQRAVTNMQIMADIANSGALIPIDVKLREGVPNIDNSGSWQ